MAISTKEIQYRSRNIDRPEMDFTDEYYEKYDDDSADKDSEYEDEDKVDDEEKDTEDSDDKKKNDETTGTFRRTKEKGIEFENVAEI